MDFEVRKALVWVVCDVVVDVVVITLSTHFTQLHHHLIYISCYIYLHEILYNPIIWIWKLEQNYFKQTKKKRRLQQSKNFSLKVFLFFLAEMDFKVRKALVWVVCDVVVVVVVVVITLSAHLCLVSTLCCSSFSPNYFFFFQVLRNVMKWTKTEQFLFL